MRRLIAAALAGIGLAAAFAQNAQTVLPLDDAWYARLDAARIIAGLAPASQVRPYTRAEAAAALAALEGRAASVPGALLASLRGRLEPQRRFALSPDLAFGLDPVLAVELYEHLALKDEGTGSAPYLWNYGWAERAPLVSLPFRFETGEWLAAVFRFDFKEDYRAVDDRYSPAGKATGSADANHSNLPGQLAGVDTYQPARASLSAGKGAANLLYGREPISWGNGQGGNLIFSTVPEYLDSLRFKLFSGPFDFASVYSVVQSPEPAAGQPWDYTGFIAHRLEFRPFGQRANFALTEAVAFGGDASIPNLIHDLNPFDIYHGWTYPRRTNSLMAAEAGWTFWPGFHLYGQFAVDEFRTAPEAAAGDAKPSAFGRLAGLRGAFGDGGDGYFRFYAEAALTDPYLYNQKNAGMSFPYIWRRYLWSFVDPQASEWVAKPIGWWAGPDALSFDAELRWERPGRYGAALRFSRIAKGEVDLGDPFPSDLDLSAPSGRAETTTVVGAAADGFVFGAWEWRLNLRYVTIVNFGHVSGAARTSVEAAAALRYHW